MQIDRGNEKLDMHSDRRKSDTPNFAPAAGVADTRPKGVVRSG